MSLLVRIAQVALATPFVVLGYQTVADPGPRAEAAKTLGFSDPQGLVQATGAAMVLGGAGLALNLLPRAAATGLAASLVPTTLAGHSFWNTTDADLRAAKQVQFLKNLGLCGGLIAVAVRGPKSAQ